jgi:hypothetical protein
VDSNLVSSKILDGNGVKKAMPELIPATNSGSNCKFIKI